MPRLTHQRRRCCGSSWTRPGVYVSRWLACLTSSCAECRHQWHSCLTQAPNGLAQEWASYMQLVPMAPKLTQRTTYETAVLWCAGLALQWFSKSTCLGARAGASRRRCRRTLTVRCSRPWPRASPPAPAPGAAQQQSCGCGLMRRPNACCWHESTQTWQPC